MDRDFWKARWDTNEIAFHRSEVHPTLLANVHWFLDRPCRVLVPLCGKSLDVGWLAKRGHSVVGVEFVRDAVEQFFAEHGLDADVERVGSFEVFRAGRIEIWCGDWFKADPRIMGSFDRVWDRGAMVAMHPDQRAAYVRTLRGLLADDGVVLVDVIASRPDAGGPPFAISDAVMRESYAGAQVERIDERGDDRPGFMNAVYAVRGAAQ